MSNGVSEGMYKKRIRAWRVLKNVKAAEKDEAITKILGGSLTADTPIPVSLEKLVRHAKSRHKNGALDSGCLEWIEKQSKHFAHDQACLAVGTMRPTASVRPHDASTLPTKLKPSLSLSDSFADTDLFLRTVKVFMLTRDTASIQRQNTLAERIAATLYCGIQYWNSRALTSARKAMEEAAEMIFEDLLSGNTSAIDILYYLNPIKWGDHGPEIFREFVEYMVKATSQALGQNHPYALMMRKLRTLRSTNELVAMWDCILDYCQRPEQDIHEWWHTAKCRWLYCRQIGMPGRAKSYCEQAVATVREISGLHITMEASVFLQLGASYLDTGNFEAAKAAYNEAFKLGSVDPTSNWWMKSSALYHLAVMHERLGEINQAVECLKEDLEIMLEFNEVDTARPIEVFQRLLCLCKRNNLHHDFEHLKKRYTQLYKCLEKMTNKCWDTKLEKEIIDEDTENGFPDHEDRSNNARSLAITQTPQHNVNLNSKGCQYLSPICGVGFHKSQALRQINIAVMVQT